MSQDLRAYVENYLTNKMSTIPQVIHPMVRNIITNEFNSVIHHIQQKWPQTIPEVQLSELLNGYFMEVTQRANIAIGNTASTGMFTGGFSNQGSTLQTGFTNSGGGGIVSGSNMFSSNQGGLFQTGFSGTQPTLNQPYHQPVAVEEKQMLTPDPEWNLSRDKENSTSNNVYSFDEYRSVVGPDPIDHKIIEWHQGVNSVSDLTEKVILLRTHSKKRFLYDISAKMSVYLDVDPTIVAKLYELYKQEGVLDNRSLRSAKAIVTIAMEFLDVNNRRTGIQLEQFFLKLLKPLIQTYLVNPDAVTEELNPHELKDVLQFFDGSIYTELSAWSGYEDQLHMVLKSALVDSIQPARVCDWNQSADRVDMLLCNNNYIKTVDGHQLLNVAMSTLDDMPEGSTIAKHHHTLFTTQRDILRGTVVNVPIWVVYTNIFSNYWQYIVGSQQVFPPVAITDANDILSDLLIRYRSVAIEQRYIVIQPDDIATINIAWGDMFTKLKRITPAKRM